MPKLISLPSWSLVFALVLSASSMVAASSTALAADGDGTMALSPNIFTPGATNQTLTFTFTAGAQNFNNGSQATVVVPTGWTAPRTTAGAGQVTTTLSGTTPCTTATPSVSGMTITIALQCPVSGTFTLTYAGVTVPSTTGPHTFTTQTRRGSGGTMTNIASQPTATVYAANGSGTITATKRAVMTGSTGQTVAFTYTAAAGGMNDGSVTVAVPTGWSAPSTTASAAGYTTASPGTVSVSGQTITVSGVTLAAGGTLTITYGSRASGGPGATAPSTTGSQTWQAQQRSINTGTLTNLASSPSTDFVTWNSYNTTSTACGVTQSDAFTGASQSVCGSGSSFPTTGSYSASFYDGAGNPLGGQVLSGTGTRSSSSFSLYNVTYVPGTWHVVVFEGGTVPGSNYASIAGNSLIVGDDTFTVDGTAVPGLPTPLAALLASLGGGGFYYFLRRRVLPVRA